MFGLKNLGLAALSISAAYAQAPKIRYMPFGDSITEIVCWRGLLWTQLQGAGFTNVDFVGSGTNENPSGCPTKTYNKNNEGHSGFLAIDIANKKQLVGWLQKNPADVITMHLGTNDIVQKSDKTADILAAFTTLIKVMRDSNPNMKIIVCNSINLDLAFTTVLRAQAHISQVAQIIPCTIGSYTAQINALNSAIPAWATGLNTTNSPIWVVDQNTGITSDDLRDGIHPNPTKGDPKMAAKWYPALVNALKIIEANATITPSKREVEFIS